jgi:hypothetical protein
METKIWTKCGQERPIEDFYWRNKAKGIRRSDCKYCHNNYVKEKYLEKHETIESLKSQCKCAKCGENRGYLLDYHHIDPSIKDSGISQMLANNRKYDDIIKEINKCVVLCANCHREFHYLKKEINLNIQQYLNKNIEELKKEYPQLIKPTQENFIFPQKQKEKHIHYCSQCGVELSTGTKGSLCLECTNKKRAEEGAMGKITKEELKNLIRALPFTQIGSQYGITDNAVRKYCDKFNLPRTKKEINSYTDEQWALI